MKLTKIAIKNYRSINYLEIDIDKNFKILVGKNESGKTNILKALSLLDIKTKASPDDIREPLPDEETITEAYVRFIFSASEEEKKTVLKEVEGEILQKNREASIIRYQDKLMTLSEFIDKHSQALYITNLLSQDKFYSYWSLWNGYSFVGSIKSPKNYIAAANEAKKTANYLFIDETYVKKEDTIELVEVDINVLHTLISQKFDNLLKKSHPLVTFWKYDEKNLLPSSIATDSFIANPDICMPLKNLFLLAGIKKIGDEITNAKKGSATKFKNLLDRVSGHATKHFKEIWKEYKDISFSLSPNGLNIDAGIKERNTYTFSQRSDGFKRFMSFLLKLSADNKNNILTNNLILVDEPDISLHPSGIRYLRDELLAIAKNNTVFTSTHSIFMIDEKCIDRHYIVRKEEEKTIIEIPDEHNIIDEEVLYRAMGYSVYELLNKTNFLFEGWRDKKLFKTALERVPSTYKEIKDVLKKVGISHSFGVNSIKNIVQMFELSDRTLFILSDNDKAAIDKQKEFEKQRLYGSWLKYIDVDSKFSQKTGEDFIKIEVIKKTINELKKEHTQIAGYPVYDNLSNGIISNIEVWLTLNNFSAQQKNNFINSIKEAVFENLRPSDIKEEYYDFLKKLCEFIKE